MESIEPDEQVRSLDFAVAGFEAHHGTKIEACLLRIQGILLYIGTLLGVYVQYDDLL